LNEPYRRSAPGFAVIVTSILTLVILLKLPTLVFPHSEWDEQVYWELAKRLLVDGQYSLQGLSILRQLPAAVYDQPLFHHPPLFPLLLTPFASADQASLAVVVSWMGHLLCIIAVALIGHTLLRSARPSTPAHDALFWLPVLGVALDPGLTFVSRKLWIDSLLAGLASLSIAMFYRATTAEPPRRRLLLVIGGILLGLAALTKLIAVVVVPAILVLIVGGYKTMRERIAAAVWGGLPCVALVALWLVPFYWQFGTLLPHWTVPPDEILQTNAFLKASLNRSPHYYPIQLSLVQPLYPMCCVLFPYRRLGSSIISLAAWVWLVGTMLIVAMLGMGGYGFMMRLLSPLYPSIYVLAYGWLLKSEQDRPVIQLICLLCIVYAGMQGAYYLVDWRSDELLWYVQKAAILVNQ
jgi:4-amino-4-deoxy-L-arabinose transferase-like glycosyltransferase